MSLRSCEIHCHPFDAFLGQIEIYLGPCVLTSFVNSNVPTVNDVLVPETLLKKRKSDAQASAKAAANKVELRKASIFISK